MPITITIRLGRTFSYNVELLLVTLHYPSVIWSCIVMLHIYHGAWGHQTCHGGGITQEPPTLKFAWPLNHLVLCGHVTDSMHHISNWRRYMGTKLSKVLNCHDKVPSLKLHDLLIGWGQRESTWQMKYTKKHIYLLFGKYLRLLNIGGCWLQGVGSECKHIIHIRSKFTNVFNYFCFLMIF